MIAATELNAHLAEFNEQVGRELTCCIMRDFEELWCWHKWFEDHPSPRWEFHLKFRTPEEPYECLI